MNSILGVPIPQQDQQTKRIVVTGGTGFIGSHVAEELVNAGHRVIVVDDLTGGFKSNVPAGAELITRSVTEPLDDLFQSGLDALCGVRGPHQAAFLNTTNSVFATAIL